MPFGRQRILGAWLTRGEILQQTMMLSAVKGLAEVRALWDSYERARALLPSLKPLPADPPEVLPLPSSAREHVQKVEQSAAFQESFGGTGYSFCSVPIDHLTSVQIFCNVDPTFPPPPQSDLPAIFGYALPPDPAIECETIVTPTGFRFSTGRYGHGLNNVKRRVIGGRATLCFEHPNLVQVRKIGNSLILFNGTHRALELFKAGATHIPAILIEHQAPNEVEWPQGPGFWNPPFMVGAPRQPGQGARPPVIPDFLSELSVECRVVLMPSVVDVNLGSSPTQTPQQGQPIAIQIGGMVPH